MIHINYAQLREDEKLTDRIDDETLKKGKGFFGRSTARQAILNRLNVRLRVIAAEIAQREIDPQELFNPGVEGLWEALEAFRVGSRDPHFEEFAAPFIRQHMRKAKERLQRTKQLPG